MSRFLTFAVVAFLVAHSPIGALARDGGGGDQGWVTTSQGTAAVGYMFYPNSGIKAIDLTSAGRQHLSLHRHSRRFSAGKPPIHADASTVSETGPPPQALLLMPSLPNRAPACSESGSCYGDISDTTRLPKTPHVNGPVETN